MLTARLGSNGVTVLGSRKPGEHDCEKDTDEIVPPTRFVCVGFVNCFSLDPRLCPSGSTILGLNRGWMDMRSQTKRRRGVRGDYKHHGDSDGSGVNNPTPTTRPTVPYLVTAQTSECSSAFSSVSQKLSRRLTSDLYGAALLRHPATEGSDLERKVSGVSATHWLGETELVPCSRFGQTFWSTIVLS